jgi:ubiquinone biosynthesis protein
MPRRRLLGRLAMIVMVVGVQGMATVTVALAALVVGGRDRARAALYRGLVRGLQALGPTFVKFGQIAATRRDTMPARLCDALGTLHDAVAPMSPRRTRRALDSALRAGPGLELESFGERAVAGGSIATVHRAVLRDGRVVALKLKRPGIDGRMKADLALLELLVRRLQRLPRLRGMPLADLVAYISKAILGQLDFAREAANIALLAKIVEPLPDIRVPVLYAELCSPGCLVFEFIPGLDSTAVAALPAATRDRLAAETLRAAHRMMFVEGFVHCDPHPGNLYVTGDERVVILDAGYCVRLPDRVRDLIGEFFARLAAGDGRRCGEIVLESAVDAGPQTDREGFLRAMTELVASAAGPGHEFAMGPFGDRVFELQQRHRIYAESDFAFPLMSMLVLEGTVRAISPAADFQQVGVA